MTRPPSPNTAPHSGARVLAAVVLVAGLALALGSTAGAWSAGAAPAPFAWGDVALVQFVCALPLAAVLAVLAHSRLPPAGALALAAGALGATIALLAGEFPADDASAQPTASAEVGAALRAGCALAAAVGVLLAGSAVAALPRPAAPALGWRRGVALGLLGGAALVLPPITYTSARCRHDTAALGELLDQSRFGEARALLRGLLVLEPEQEFHGRPLAEVAEEVQKVIADLEARVARPLGRYATTRERFDRARALAMLGRTQEALDVSAPIDDPVWNAEVQGLRGTLHETREEWAAGLTAYRAARAEWERRPESQARGAGIVRSVTGIAYCLRKAGRYTEAEEAYSELLALAPTADTHFLLAQFYEDAQQAGKARTHALRAIELAPDRYGAEGRRLIRKLTVFQFGCLGVFNEGGEPAHPESR